MPRERVDPAKALAVVSSLLVLLLSSHSNLFRYRGSNSPLLGERKVRGFRVLISLEQSVIFCFVLCFVLSVFLCRCFVRKKCAIRRRKRPTLATILALSGGRTDSYTSSDVSCVDKDYYYPPVFNESASPDPDIPYHTTDMRRLEDYQPSNNPMLGGLKTYEQIGGVLNHVWYPHASQTCQWDVNTHAHTQAHSRILTHKLTHIMYINNQYRGPLRLDQKFLDSGHIVPNTRVNEADSRIKRIQGKHENDDTYATMERLETMDHDPWKLPDKTKIPDTMLTQSELYERLKYPSALTQDRIWFEAPRMKMLELRNGTWVDAGIGTLKLHSTTHWENQLDAEDPRQLVTTRWMELVNPRSPPIFSARLT